MGVKPAADLQQTALRSADAVASLIEKLDLPSHLSAYKLTAEQLEWAIQPMADGPYPLDDLRGIFRAAQ
jgi:hypothetical protein